MQFSVHNPRYEEVERRRSSATFEATVNAIKATYPPAAHIELDETPFLDRTKIPKRVLIAIAEKDYEFVRKAHKRVRDSAWFTYERYEALRTGGMRAMSSYDLTKEESINACFMVAIGFARQCYIWNRIVLEAFDAMPDLLPRDKTLDPWHNNEPRSLLL